MSCTAHHLLIERGVKARELGHSIMEGIKMDSQILDDLEHYMTACSRLRNVNAKLLAALEGIGTCAEEAPAWDDEVKVDIAKLARAAIEEGISGSHPDR